MFSVRQEVGFYILIRFKLQRIKKSHKVHLFYSFMTTVRKYMLINKEVKILWQMCEQPKNNVVFLYLDYF